MLMLAHAWLTLRGIGGMGTMQGKCPMSGMGNKGKGMGGVKGGRGVLKGEGMVTWSLHVHIGQVGPLQQCGLPSCQPGPAPSFSGPVQHHHSQSPVLPQTKLLLLLFRH